MPFFRRFWPILLLLILPVLPLWKSVFAGAAIGPFDQIRQMAPWNGPKPEEPWDVLQADGVLQFYPWRDMVFKSYAEGHLPLWNHYELAGTPLLANSQSAGFYPPHIAMSVLRVPTPAAMTMLAWFHLALAGVGVYFLSRRLGGTKLGATVGGISFQLSAFMLLWTALPSVPSTVAWIPWMLGATVSLFSGTGRAALLLAFATGMMILAGHLQFVAYGFMAELFLLVWLSVQHRTLSKAVVGIASLALGVCLAAPQLFPVLNYSQYSHRKVAASTDLYPGYIAGAIKPFELANLGYSKVLGDPREGTVIGNGSNLSHYWPMYAKQGANLAEGAVTVGPLIIGLLVLVNWRRGEAQMMAAIGILALLLALGTPLNMIPYYLVPGWASTGSPGRIVVLFVLAACVLGSLGIRDESDRRRLITSVSLASTLTLVIGLSFSSFAPAWQSGLDQIGEVMKGEATSSALPMLFVAMLLGGFGIATLGTRARKVEEQLKFKFASQYALIPAAIAICLLSGIGLIPQSRAIQVETAKDFARIAAINSGWGIIGAASAILPPNTAYLQGLHELGGYDSLLHRDTKAMLDRINGGKDSAPPANGNMMFIKPVVESASLAEAGVTSIYSKDGVQSVDGPGRVSVEGGTATIISENSQQIKLRATGPGRLVLRDRNMPGWLPKVDGKHVPLLGTTWREIDLPAGEHQVEFNYVTPGLMLGIYLALPAWLLLLVAFLAIRSKKTNLSGFETGEASA